MAHDVLINRISEVLLLKICEFNDKTMLNHFCMEFKKKVSLSSFFATGDGYISGNTSIRVIMY